MDKELKAMKQKRFEYLRLLYKTTQGDCGKMVSASQLASELGLNHDEAERIFTYLHQNRLISTLVPDKISITRSGVSYIEEALSEPDEPTAPLPPANIMVVGEIANSQVQQGTHQSMQIADFSHDDLEDVANFINSLKGQLSEFGLAPEKEGEAQADIASVEAQLKSPRPKSSIIKECLLSLRNILEGAAGNAAAALLLPQLVRLLGIGP